MKPFPHRMDMDYPAIRTARYKYVHCIKHADQDELTTCSRIRSSGAIWRAIQRSLR